MASDPSQSNRSRQPQEQLPSAEANPWVTPRPQHGSENGSRSPYDEPFTLDYNPDPDFPPESAAGSADNIGADSSHAEAFDAVAPSSSRSAQLSRSRDRFPAGQPPINLVAIAAALVVLLGLWLNSFWLILVGSLGASGVALRLLNPTFQEIARELSPRQQSLFVAVPTLLLGLVGLLKISGLNQRVIQWESSIRWDIVGSIGDFLGAIGQIFIAILAVYVAWRQYIISRDLTLQQNLITQQQTIDAYFQGISELVLDDEGLLEDWPQERVIAEARTAAILSSIDANGKAKVLRFLSRSKLLTPLARDRRLGRPILDGAGGYAEDRQHGTRVIDIGVMLAASDLSGTDLRWIDLSAANLIRANFTGCDLVRVNFAGTILCDAQFVGADLFGVQLFHGDIETATPRTRSQPPNHSTGEFSGAVVEGADFTAAERMSEAQRRYCCAWGGEKTRATVPGGCEDIPNRLGR